MFFFKFWKFQGWYCSCWRAIPSQALQCSYSYHSWQIANVTHATTIQSLDRRFHLHWSWNHCHQPAQQQHNTRSELILLCSNGKGTSWTPQNGDDAFRTTFWSPLKLIKMAPSSILNLMFCGCKAGCSKTFGCRKLGLHSTPQVISSHVYLFTNHVCLAHQIHKAVVLNSWTV